MNDAVKSILFKVVVWAVFGTISVVVAFMLISSIAEPITFNKKYEERFEAVKQKMIKIRDAQVAYESINGKYANNFDSLVDFIKNDSLILVKAFGSVPDSIYSKATSKLNAELRALELGLISRDTSKVSVMDSLFHNNYNVDTLKFIPYSNQEEVFQMNAKIIRTLSKVDMPTFELKAHNNSFLKGLEPQLIINKNDAARDNEKWPGLIVGSLTEVSVNGNWD